ncbi:MAG: metallophosphoesterase [Micrococcales bacterium]|nr:metallophosphoesterase [Micrococcales bacterium]
MALQATRPAPTHVLAHLSDTHLIAGGGLLHGRVDTAAQFRRALDRLEASAERVDALVISGDLTDAGDEVSYALLLEIATPVAQRLGAELILTGGNHDERRPLARALYGNDTDAPQDRVTTIRGLRILAIDSAPPGYHYGGFDDAQYDWLARELATQAEHGTILVMHHPPITYRSPTMQLLDFEETGRLRATLEGSDVRAILSGHLHVTTFGTLGAIPVLVAGGVSFADDAGAPRERMMAADGPQSYSLVEVHPDQVVATVVAVAEHERWPALSPEVSAYLDTVPQQELREVFARRP